MKVTKFSGNIIETELNGELVVMNIENGEYFGLKTTGMAIWRLLDEHSNVEEIIKHLAQHYAVSPELCNSEVISFVRELESAGFVKIG